MSLTKVTPAMTEGLASTADLASTASGKGAALVALQGGGTVQDAISYVTPEMFGAVGDGTTNDTTAVQAAWDAGPLVLMSGTYSVTNLTIPDRVGFSVNLTGSIVARSGGDSYYLIASSKHLADVASAQTGIVITGRGLINGAGLVDYPFIMQNWNSRIDLRVTGGLKSGFVVSAQTRSGATFPTSSMVNNRLLLISYSNGGCGLLVRDSLRNNATDGQLLPGSILYGNSECAAFIDSGAGWTIKGVQTYGNTKGGICFNGVGKGTTVEGCFVDDGDGSTIAASGDSQVTYKAAVSANAHLTHGIFLVANNWLSGPVTTSGNGDTAPYAIASKNNTYSGANAFLYHQYFGATRWMISENDNFTTTDPFRHNNGSSTGVYMVKGAVLTDASLNCVLSASFNATNKVYSRFADFNPADGMGNARTFRLGLVSSGGSFSFTMPIGVTASFDTLYVDLHLTTRATYNGAVRVKYLGRVAITTKDNGAGNAWVAALDNVVYTAGEWTAPPAVSISNPTSTTGLLTITGDPIDADGFGAMRAMLVR